MIGLRARASKSGSVLLFRVSTAFAVFLGVSIPTLANSQSVPEEASVSGAIPSVETMDNEQPAPPANDQASSAERKAAPHDFAYIDTLGHKGWATPFPKMSDTILGEAGGVRSKLAEAGIGFLVLSKNTVLYNVLDYDGPAVYNGKKPTYSTGIQSLFLTFDAGKVGVEGGQLFFTLAAITNGLKAVNGPKYARIGALGYYQKLADGAVEIKAGYFDNAQEYVGTAIAGSLAAGTLGPQARIPVQLGFGYNGLGTPAINVRLNAKNGLYSKFGVQRAVPPGGRSLGDRPERHGTSLFRSRC